MDFVGGTVVAGRFRLVRELGARKRALYGSPRTRRSTPPARSSSSTARPRRTPRCAAASSGRPNRRPSSGAPTSSRSWTTGSPTGRRTSRWSSSRVRTWTSASGASGASRRRRRSSSCPRWARRSPGRTRPASSTATSSRRTSSSSATRRGTSPRCSTSGSRRAACRSLADSSTKTGALMGTPYYMSPEQTRGTKSLDHRSDLWALAVIVFQCVTGRLPFLSESLGDLRFKIGTDPLPAPPGVARPARELDALVGGAAMRDPDAAASPGPLVGRRARDGLRPLAGRRQLLHGRGDARRRAPRLGAPSGGWGGSQSGRLLPSRAWQLGRGPRCRRA